MRLTIFAKVAVMLVVSIAAVVIPLVYITFNTLDSVLTEEAEASITYKSVTVNSDIQGMRDSVESVLWQAAKRADLIEAVATGDLPTLVAAAKDMDSHSSIDFITFTDAAGKVLLRGHSDKKGDSLAHVVCIKSALSGTPITIGLETGKEVAFSVRGAVPILQNGTLVGTLSVGVRLDEIALAESIQKRLGVEISIFKGNTCISTSFKDSSGKPAIGVEMKKEDIIRTVFDEGKVYMAHSTIISGVEYDALYYPLKDNNGKVLGMYFLGTPSTTLQALKASILNQSMLVGGGLALLMAAIGIFLARFIISKPIARVSNVIRDLVDDKAELSYRFDTSSRDEVASLAHQVNRLTGKVEGMLCNIEGYKNLMNAIPEPVFAVDDDYKVTLVNERICRLANVKDPTVLYGKHVNDVLHTNIYGSSNCPLREVMKTRKRSVSEIFPLQIDGHERLIRGLSDVIKDCHGNDAGFFQVASDVTDMVEQERKMAAQMERISEVNRKVTDIAAQVNQSANTIQQQTGTIQQAAEQQSGLMGETLHSIQQMNDTVMEIARSASTASSNAGAGQQRAAEGEKIVNEAMEAIDSVRSLAEALNTSLGQLDSQAESIGAVLNVISDIADQTNLLALNAAIEAARAGDAGRGFAVVADSVRQLAEKTMGATQEVRKATEDIQHGAKDNISNMLKVAQAVENATELSRHSGTALAEIVDLVSQTSAQIASIATAAEEQSASSEDMAKSVNEVTVIAQNTVNQATDSAKAVDELAALAHELHKTVS